MDENLNLNPDNENIIPEEPAATNNETDIPEVPENQPAYETENENIQPEEPVLSQQTDSFAGNPSMPEGGYYNNYQGQQMYPGQNQPYNQPPYGGQYEQPLFQYQQPAVPVKKKKKPAVPLNAGQKKIVWILRAGILLIALFFVYCIVMDVAAYMTHSAPAYAESSEAYDDDYADDADVIPPLYRESKPELNDFDEDMYYDDLKYTAEEIALYVSPSIVQIDAFTGGQKGSSGSGIILNEEGYILTNAHVVSQFDSFEVTLYNEEEPYEAELVGYDSKSDLAVIRIDADDLIPAVFGDSDELNVGEEVVAIGNPAGLSGSVTKGIVSALDRQIRTGTTGFYMECIQTDAAISPGNSGGALVNMYGQVVGVTSSKYASAYYGGVYEGLGFAISINQAMPIAEELMTNGYISGRVRIGITFSALKDSTAQEEFAANFNAAESPCKEGLWITEVSPDCDIANTELSANDIILSVNGKKVNNYSDLWAIIENCKAGDELTAKCRRYTFGENKNELKHRDFTIKFKLMEDRSGDY